MTPTWFRFNIRDIEFFCVVIFEIIFLGMYFQAFSSGNTYHSYIILYSFILTLVPPILEWKMNLSLPLGLKLVVPLALLFNAGGGIVQWYWASSIFDVLAHVMIGIAAGLIAFRCYIFLDYFKYTLKKPIIKRELHFFHTQKMDVIVGMTIMVFIMIIIWQFGEFFVDLIIHSDYIRGFTDSLLDIFWDMIGYCIILYFSARSMDSIPEGEHLEYLLRKRN